MNYFINFSNHPSSKWSAVQFEEARKYGEIIDIPFPMVDPAMDSDSLKVLMDEYIQKIMSYRPNVVMCQGEMTAAFYAVSALIKNNIKVLAACSERRVSEAYGNGTSIKTVEFLFVRFREYII